MKSISSITHQGFEHQNTSPIGIVPEHSDLGKIELHMCWLHYGKHAKSHNKLIQYPLSSYFSVHLFFYCKPYVCNRHGKVGNF